ncbi:hypothetical protein JNUCC0626_29975 [Lentzea sp. JNUCC 0626]
MNRVAPGMTFYYLSATPQGERRAFVTRLCAALGGNGGTCDEDEW